MASPIVALASLRFRAVLDPALGLALLAFCIAFAYARYMNRNVDPLARALPARYDAALHGKGTSR